MGLARKSVLFFILSLFLSIPFAQADSHLAQNTAAIPAIFIAELPPEARETLQVIKHGGPFPYARDGAIFGNYERILPPQPRGYYHEYTVKTPGVRHRGARRIVCGILPECYYSTDHYRSFRRIREEGR
jgi:ribonuclease T1